MHKRLTYIDQENEEIGYVIDHENFDKAVDKLAEFEDFMEEQGFESLEGLKIKLGKSFYVYKDEVKQGKVFNGVFFSYEQLMVMDAWNEFNNDYFKKYLDKQRETQALKDTREKLKQWFNTHYELNLKAKDKDADILKYILDKMEELEKGGNNNE